MNTTQALAILQENQNEKGIQKWNELYPDGNGLKTFGIGLTVLRKLAKQIGRDHELALKLWNSEYYDAKVIALLIDDPKQITREQAEIQVDHLNQGLLAHVFSSCDASLAKTSFVVPLLEEWIHSKDSTRMGCGYGLLYEVSKSKKRDAPTDDYFLERIQEISQSFDQAPQSVKLAMGGALIGIGKRNATVNASALKVAKSIGPIEFESRSGKCEPLDVVKHLTSDYLREKFADK